MPTREIVVGDLCIVEEGRMINADGVILHGNDFSVNEASLTRELLKSRAYVSKTTGFRRIIS
ncbi:hypothetical protein [Sphingobacterium sp. HMA12]|uniref:P-type ATPase n=1 Tax=Sphingobacterium sp. HMA12 TaxID=2050894 RepID=UPI00352A1F1D